MDSTTPPPAQPARQKLVLDLDFFGAPAPAAQGRVLLLPMQRWVDLEPRESIFEGAKRAGIAIPTECGGKGTCWRCRVQFSSPAPEPTVIERLHIHRADLARGVRLACRCRPTTDVTVTILPERK
jgi:ferredoxin